MKNLIIFVFFIAAAICASAQKVYFIYLQSDNGNPFYVKMSDKIYSSAISGYLILSDLKDSIYNFSIGFPSSQSESKFAVSVNGKDKGFLIKNFDEGLGLFDLQSLSVIKSQKEERDKTISYQRRNDDFSSLLSKAAKDTSLLYAVVRINEDVVIQKKESKSEEPKQKIEEPILIKDTVSVKPQQTDITSEIKKEDTAAIVESNQELKKQNDIANTFIKEDSKTDTIAFAGQKEPAMQSMADTITNKASESIEKTAEISTALKNGEEAAIYKKSRIKKHSESSTSEGFGLVFFDVYDGGKDTIRLLIPNPPITLTQANPDSAEQQKDFIRVDELKKNIAKQAPIVVAVKNNAPVKSQCKSLASNNDFFKLRKNMASENTDEAMVSEAKKVFKTKCFTTEQIRNLSALFLTSAGKYQFFDAAYLHVSDQEQFSSLESEMKDDYYLKRFKALVGE